MGSEPLRLGRVVGEEPGGDRGEDEEDETASAAAVGPVLAPMGIGADLGTPLPLPASASEVACCRSARLPGGMYLACVGCQKSKLIRLRLRLRPRPHDHDHGAAAACYAAEEMQHTVGGEPLRAAGARATDGGTERTTAP